MSRTRIGLMTLAVLLTAVAWAQQPPRASSRRVEPKPFEPNEVQRVFFDDVFQVLIGQRPTLRGAPAVASVAGRPAATDSSNSTSTSESSASDGATAGSGWSRWISATTIEDEVKKLKLQVDQDVTTPGDFRGRGYTACRQHFSMAAMLFAIIQEYDGEVRWKEEAPIARELFSRTAANAKVGTTQVFNEAKLRKTDLADLINGSRLAGGGETSSTSDWGAIVDRAPLMKRLETALDGEIKKLTANEGDFKSNQEKLIHEAEIVAAIGAVLARPGMEDGDDETYAEYLEQMKAAARDIVEGARKGDYELARKSAGAIDQACSVCHESYRG